MAKQGQLRRAINYNRSFYCGGPLEENAILANECYTRMILHINRQLDRLRHQQKAELRGDTKLLLPIKTGL